MTAETSNARGEWVLVPREPTEAMLDVMHSRIRILCDPAERTAAIQNDREVWAAMLAAAPPAPVSVPLDRLTALDGLVDRIAEAIRDGAGLAEGDPPWERLGEERRAPWRADAKRALSVIKESLTAEMGAGVGEPDVQYADADALIALGWTPPGAQQPAAEAQGGGDVVQRLRGVLQHAKMGNSYLISQDLIHKAIGAITAPPSAPVGVDWITGDGLQGIKAEAHFLTQHKEEAVQRAGKRLLDRADKIIAALSQQPAPSAPVGVEKVKKALERLDRTIEACAKLTQLLGDGQPHSDLISTAGGQAALAKEAIQRALAQQTAAVDEGFVSRLAEALTDQDWDVDPDGDGSGIAQLRAAVVAAQRQEPTT